MKTTLIGLVLLAFAVAGSAADKSKLDDRIRSLTAKFEALQQNPEKAIPAVNLRRAQGIILLDRTKAGFIFAYQGGGGVAMVRDPKNGKWGPTAFLQANEGSLGFQVGGEQNFFVILLMNTNATRLLTESTFDFGGEARGTAGDTSTGVEGKVASHEQPVIVYNNRKGLYGGAAVKGGAISPNDEANRVYYGEFVTMQDIVFGKKVKATESATTLADKINEYSKKSDQ